jgi:hypothetical protein
MLDPNASINTTVFTYAQRLLEIMFVVSMLSCILTVVFPMLMPGMALGQGTAESSPGSVFSGSLANRQLNSLMVNMQRTFAETVASFVTDVQTRKMIVLLGLCMLPSISSVVSSGQQQQAQKKVSDIRSIESFFLASVSQRRRAHASSSSSTSYVYANFLAKLWIAGLSMAWMNTTLGFILPSTAAGGYANALALWMRVISTICLAVLSRSLQPMFPGLSMFQAYIEWSIATSTLSSVRLSSRNQMTTLSTVFCTGLAFYIVDAIYRDTVRTEEADACKRRAHADDSQPDIARFSTTLQTLQSVTIIMFTNSLVSWAMELISTSSSGGGGSGVGQAFATVVAGIVVSRVIVQVCGACAFC